MWYDEAVVYQIYPLGLCGAPLQNDGDQAQAGEHRILRVLDWVEHIKRLGATCVLFNPLFESDARREGVVVHEKDVVEDDRQHRRPADVIEVVFSHI